MPDTASICLFDILLPNKVRPAGVWCTVLTVSPSGRVIMRPQSSHGLGPSQQPAIVCMHYDTNLVMWLTSMLQQIILYLVYWLFQYIVVFTKSWINQNFVWCLIKIWSVDFSSLKILFEWSVYIEILKKMQPHVPSWVETVVQYMWVDGWNQHKELFVTQVKLLSWRICILHTE